MSAQNQKPNHWVVQATPGCAWVSFLGQLPGAPERTRWAEAKAPSEFWHFNRGARAFTVVEILVIIGIIALFVGMLIPALDNKPTRAPKAACVNNLRHIDEAQQSWAFEHGKTTNDMPGWSDLQQYLKTNQMKCPSGGKYTLTVAGQAPTCSVPEHQSLFLANRRPAILQ